MKPELALKIKYVPWEKYSKEQIEDIKEQWIQAYVRYADADMLEQLTKRIQYACDLFIKRYIEVTKAESGGKDEAYYEWIQELDEQENRKLDGDFPLGNEKDVKFANPYFTIEELAMIQCGKSALVQIGDYVEPAYDMLIRKGFIYELGEEWHLAEACYKGVSTSKKVQERELYCKKQKMQKGMKLYQKAQLCLEMEDEEAYLFYLKQSADMNHFQACVELGYAYMLGNYGLKKDLTTAIRLFTNANYKVNMYDHFMKMNILSHAVSELSEERIKSLYDYIDNLSQEELSVLLMFVMKHIN